MRTKKVQVVGTDMQKGKRLIDELVKFLNEPDPYPNFRARTAVWNVLTALRGPDSDNYVVKTRSTSALRGAIGLTGYGLTIAVVRKKPLVRSAGDVSNHFNLHYVNAVDALRALGYKVKLEP